MWMDRKHQVEQLMEAKPTGWTVQQLAAGGCPVAAIQAWAQLKVQRFLTQWRQGSVAAATHGPSLRCRICKEDVVETADHLLCTCKGVDQVDKAFRQRLAGECAVPLRGSALLTFVLGGAPTWHAAIEAVRYAGRLAVHAGRRGGSKQEHEDWDDDSD